MVSGHTDWREWAAELNVRSPLLARATGANVYTVRAYRQRRFNPSPEWVAKAERFLAFIESGQKDEVA